MLLRNAARNIVAARLGPFAACTCLVVAPASAQSNGNEVWIGQTGNTNAITIIQQGDDNAAGADNVLLRLNQDGSENSLTIDQYGWSNTVGAFVYDPDRAVGVNQVGDRNQFELRQRNTELDGSGFNTIASVYQRSFQAIATIANALFVMQSDEGGTDGTAGHFIGTIRQENNLAGAAANTIDVFQTGGGAFLGHVLDQIDQIGFANALEAYQADQDQTIRFVQQFGSANVMRAEQGGGQANRADYAQQFGNLNSATLRQTGSRNVVERVLQNNEILGGAGVGNRMEMVVSGEDNGGDGLGGVGEFLAPEALALTGVAQGNLTQFGDDNDIRVTVVQGSLTRFGVAQVGDGNGAVIAIAAVPGATADRNEAAIYQNGLDNNLSLTVLGDDNVLAGSQVGNDNRVRAIQTGDANRLALDLVGDDNNAPVAGGFGGTAALVAASGLLAPGDVVQSGALNEASVGVLGSGNLFGVAQTGSSHVASVVISGGQNQLAVHQTTSANVSLTVQTGSGNALGIRQN